MTEKLKRAIFLDLEGTVVSHRSIIVQHDPSKGEVYHGGHSGWHRFVDITSLRLVIALCHAYDAKIVVTSVLRTLPTVMEQLTSLLLRHNGRKDNLIHGITERGNNREEEIEKYVRDFEIDRWVAIDDRCLKLVNFEWINPEDGITLQNYRNCKQWLADPDSEIKHELIFL